MSYAGFATVMVDRYLLRLRSATLRQVAGLQPLTGASPR